MTAEMWFALGGGTVSLAINLIGLGVIYGRIMGRLDLIQYRLTQVENALLDGASLLRPKVPRITP